MRNYVKMHLVCFCFIQSRPVSAWNTASSTRIRRRNAAHVSVSSTVDAKDLVAALRLASAAFRERLRHAGYVQFIISNLHHNAFW